MRSLALVLAAACIGFVVIWPDATPETPAEPFTAPGVLEPDLPVEVAGEEDWGPPGGSEALERAHDDAPVEGSVPSSPRHYEEGPRGYRDFPYLWDAGLPHSLFPDGINHHFLPSEWAWSEELARKDLPADSPLPPGYTPVQQMRAAYLRTFDAHGDLENADNWGPPAGDVSALILDIQSISPWLTDHGVDVGDLYDALHETTLQRACEMLTARAEEMMRELLEAEGLLK